MEANVLKVLYLLREKPIGTLAEIIEVHKKDNEVSVLRLGKDMDFIKLIEMIVESDSVISG
jgi:hypothetical protein